VLEKVEEYVMREMHSTLFREASESDKTYAEKVDKIQWVTPT
jgi:hypothetical protein